MVYTIHGLYDWSDMKIINKKSKTCECKIKVIKLE